MCSDYCQSLLLHVCASQLVLYMLNTFVSLYDWFFSLPCLGYA